MYRLGRESPDRVTHSQGLGGGLPFPFAPIPQPGGLEHGFLRQTPTDVDFNAWIELSNLTLAFAFPQLLNGDNKNTHTQNVILGNKWNHAWKMLSAVPDTKMLTKTQAPMVVKSKTFSL